MMNDEKMLSILRDFAVKFAYSEDWRVISCIADRFDELFKGESEAITNLKAALYDKEKELSENRLNWIPVSVRVPTLHQVDLCDMVEPDDRCLISDEVLVIDTEGNMTVATFEPSECGTGGLWWNEGCDQLDVVAWCEIKKQQNKPPKEEYRDRCIEAVWDVFEDIAMNPETECIEEPFWFFHVGTHREEIWEWFDNAHSKGVHWLLYEYKKK